MLLFCPSCSNLLTVSQTSNGENGQCNRLECLTCPYESMITSRIYERTDFPAAEEKDDVFGGKGSWDNAAKMETQCPKENCNGMEAAYFEVQIRSADEPATIFYKCMTCGGSWRV